MSVIGEATDFYILASGLVTASVCTSLPVKDATERLNMNLPTGISSRWTKAADKTFATGEPNGMKCPELRGHKHYLYHC